MAQPQELEDASPIGVCVQTTVSGPAQACWVATLPSLNTPASRAGVLYLAACTKKKSFSFRHFGNEIWATMPLESSVTTKEYVKLYAGGRLSAAAVLIWMV